MRQVKVKRYSSLLHQNQGVSHPDTVGLRGLKLIDLRFWIEASITVLLNMQTVQGYVRIYMHLVLFLVQVNVAPMDVLYL